jgi:hypothetical protein
MSRFYLLLALSNWGKIRKISVLRVLWSRLELDAFGIRVRCVTLPYVRCPVVSMYMNRK